MTGTVIGLPQNCCNARGWRLFWPRRWIGQPVEVDGLGHRLPDPTYAHLIISYCPKSANLEPIGDDPPETASWTAIQKLTAWRPRVPVKAPS